MTADLEHRLREALHEDAARARLVNPDEPVAPVANLTIVKTDRGRLSTWLLVAAVMAFFALATAAVLRDDEQSVELTPSNGDPQPSAGDADSVAELSLEGTTWEIVDSSAGPISGAPVEFAVVTMGWDNGCTRVHSSFRFDRHTGTLVLSNPTPGEGCETPTTFGVTPHYPVVDAVMSEGEVRMKLLEGRLYLGDHPDGDYLVLVPLGGIAAGEVLPEQLPEPGEQPADPEAAEDEVRAAVLGLQDTSGAVEERALLSERPDTWAERARAVSSGPNWDIIKDLEWEVDEVVFLDPTHAAVRFGYTSPTSSLADTIIGNALLKDGRWVVAIETSCELFSAAGSPCA